MKIILAPDSFKGTLTAQEVCRALDAGLKRVLPDAQILSLPVADGGEGTLDVLVEALGGERISCLSVDPLGREIEVDFAILPEGEALVEMARSSGLDLLYGAERNPWVVGTYGLGLVIRAALGKDISALTVTLGGSATVDGGVGMARAIGYRFLDTRGQEIGIEGGRVLAGIRKIEKGSEVERSLSRLRVRALCDVRNPLLGPSGAAHVFGPQKGADASMVERLEQGLENLAACVEQDLGISVAGLPGSGAAGGLGAAVKAFLGGSLVPGIEYVLETLKFSRAVKDADLVISGEGSFDSQSLGGKVISGVLEKSSQAGVPVAVVCGRRADEGGKSAGAKAEEHVKGPEAVWSGADLPGGGPREKYLSAGELSVLAEKAACWLAERKG